MNQQQAKTLQNNPIFKAFLEGGEIERFICGDWVTTSKLSVDNLVDYLDEYRIKVKKLPEPPAGEEWANFHNIDAHILSEGYRLCLKSELPPREHGLQGRVELWNSDKKVWDNWCGGDGTFSTYRTKAPLPEIKPQEFPEPPANKTWHNPKNLSADIVEVNKGYRLLLKGEIIPEDYEYYDSDKKSWVFEPDYSGETVGCYNQYTTMRTKQPIQQFVPLEAPDIVFGSILRHKNWNKGLWVAVVKVVAGGVAIAQTFDDYCDVKIVSWKELQTYYQIKTPDDKDWRDCHKVS